LKHQDCQLVTDDVVIYDIFSLSSIRR